MKNKIKINNNIFKKIKNNINNTFRKIRNNISNIFDKIKYKFNKLNKKQKRYLLISILCVCVILIITVTAINNSSYRVNDITYEEIETIINNKDSAIIYYYNSKSSNRNNKSILKYLNKNNVRFYTYNDKNVDKEEYNKLLSLLNIDKSLFGCPAIIYIKDGEMFGNIINIDSSEVVKGFIDNYDLYTVK